MVIHVVGCLTKHPGSRGTRPVLWNVLLQLPHVGLEFMVVFKFQLLLKEPRIQTCYAVVSEVKQRNQPGLGDKRGDGFVTLALVKRSTRERKLNTPAAEKGHWDRRIWSNEELHNYTCTQQSPTDLGAS